MIKIQEIEKVWGLGKKYCNVPLNVLFYNQDSYKEIPFHLFSNRNWETVFLMGHDEVQCPIPVIGYRVGGFTEWGFSRNHSSGKVERGLSLMSVYDIESLEMIECSPASALFIRGEKYPVIGYYSPENYGSDGEPLVIFAEHAENYKISRHQDIRDAKMSKK